MNDLDNEQTCSVITAACDAMLHLLTFLGSCVARNISSHWITNLLAFSHAICTKFFQNKNYYFKAKWKDQYWRSNIDVM